MPLILPGNVASATAGAYEVANSCRFDGSSAYMSGTFGSPTNAKIWTFSFWFKGGSMGSAHNAFISHVNADGKRAAVVKLLNSTGQLDLRGANTADSDAHTITTNRKFRDPAAWYHIVVGWDTTQSTAANRVKIYVNGTLETSFATSTYPDEDDTYMLNGNTFDFDIGRYADGSMYFPGYMAEVCWIDGTQYAASDFGEFDSDSPTIWKPKDVSGLTFGNNGFYLDFEDSGNLGDDESGNADDLSETNIAAADQATDTPTNNFCTLNPLHIATSSPPTFSEGNLGLTSDGSNWRDSCGTIGLTNGRWYFETKAPGNTVQIGVCSQSWLNAQGANVGAREGAQATPNEAVYGWYGNNGTVYYRTSAAQGTAFSGNTWSTEVISVYLDLEDNLIYFAKDNTMENSGTGYALATGEIYFPMVVGYVSGTTYINLGSTGAFGGTAVSSAVADDNGYGAFEFDPSRGGASDFNSSAKKFYAICTKNLAEYGG